MSLPAPFSITPPSSLPDREALLLASVRQRDAAATARLLQQWVHRQGIEALNTFSTITLSIYEGPEASTWLQEQINAPDFGWSDAAESAIGGAAIPMEPSPGAQDMLMELDLPAKEGEPEPGPEPEPLTEAVTESDLQPSLELGTPLSSNLETATEPDLSAADADLHGELAVALTEAEAEAVAESDAELTIPPEPMELPRLGSLLDIDPWAPRHAGLPVDAAEFPAEPSAEPPSEPLRSAARADEPAAAPADPISAQADSISVESAVRGDHGAGVLARGGRSLSRMRSLMRDCLDGALDAVRPEPAPTEACESSAQAGSEDQGVEVPEALWTRSGDDLEQPEDDGPRKGLARFRFAPPRPDAAAAPSPQALNDLRSWLPDEAGDEDLPRAC